MLDLGQGAILTLLEEADADELFALVDRGRERLRRWLGWVDANRSAEDSLAFIRRTREQWANERALSGCIRVHGRIAGCAGLDGIDRSNLMAPIGYWIGGEFEGRGLATRAVRALVDHAFRDVLLHRVEIRCATGNARSRRVPERLGFREEGILRGAERVAGRHLDLVVYSLLATDPHPPPGMRSPGPPHFQ